jgi:hypothetical protein
MSLTYFMSVRAASSALGLSHSANVLLRASPAFPLYFAAWDNPITAEAYRRAASGTFHAN